MCQYKLGPTGLIDLLLYVPAVVISDLFVLKFIIRGNNF